MNEILSVYKPIGYTPLQMIQRLREKYPQYQHEKIGYAGRLDPLAHGVLLLMVGDATKAREQYLNLPKTYAFTALLGVETDSYDLLGFVAGKSIKKINIDNVSSIVNTFASKHHGKFFQEYPPFSSKAVQGKPLHWWAKQERLHEIILPKREIEIYTFQHTSTNTLTVHALWEKIQEEITTINGDFRLEETLSRWQTILRDHEQEVLPTVSFSVNCSSGTYVRGLIHELGKELGCGAVALEIHRTKVGIYTEEECLRLF